MNYKDSKEFLDSLVKSGEDVRIVFNTSNDTIVVNLIWNDEESVGVKFVTKEQIRFSKNPNTSDVVTEVLKEKITTYFKLAIESISTEWKEEKELESPF